MWAHADRFEPALREAKIPWSHGGLGRLIASPVSDLAALRTAAIAIAFPPTILDRVLRRTDGATETVVERWSQLLAHKGAEQDTAAAELAAALTAAEAIETAWLGPLQDLRGNATAASRALVAAAVQRDPAGALDALTGYADHLVEVGAPVRVTPMATTHFNAYYGVVLEGAVLVAEQLDAVPPERFDAFARTVAGRVMHVVMWRPIYARYLATLPAARAATLPSGA
jgi:hypothetical protein